jgi:hypothetical protein
VRGREEEKKRRVHHKGTKINTKDHKEDRKTSEEFRSQKAQNTKGTKEGAETAPALSPSWSVLLNSLFWSSLLSCVFFVALCVDLRVFVVNAFLFCLLPFVLLLFW